jgi:hypothetical protein
MFDSLSDINCDLIQRVKPGDPCLIYIGVGTFAGLKNGESTIDAANYHQYPPFFQDLKNQITGLQVILILIDPCQEDPPYVCLDKNLEFKAGSWSNTDNSLIVYPLRKKISGEKILSDLQALNCYAIENRLAVFYHTYTGYRDYTYRLFENDLADNLDHIVYNRIDLDCYFDLNRLYYPWRLDTTGGRPLVKIYQAADLNAQRDTYEDREQGLIGEHIERLSGQIQSDIKNNIFAILRAVKSHRPLENTALLEYLGKKGIALLNTPAAFDQLLTYFGREVDILLHLTGAKGAKGAKMSGKEWLAKITAHPDMYAWTFPPFETL